MTAVNNNISVQDGMFVIDGEKYDLGAAMMKLNMDRTKVLDDQIAGKMQDIASRNNQIKMLNTLLAEVRKHKAEGRDDDAGWGGSSKEGKSLTMGNPAQTKTLEQWASDLGVTSWTDVQYNADASKRDQQWDANISSIQAVVDGLNSDSQMGMTQLQSLMNKRNQASDMTTNILSTDKKAMDDIIGNLR